MFCFLTFMLSTTIIASVDDKLNNYITEFNYQALKYPSTKREKLYHLGFRLFYSQELSFHQNISCHDCHQLGAYSGDAMPLGLGEGAKGIGLKRRQGDAVILHRHTPALYNLADENVTRLFWDGRVEVLEDNTWLTPEDGLNGAKPQFQWATKLENLLAVQSLFPMTNPAEMLGKNNNLSFSEALDSILKRLFEGKLSALNTYYFKEAYPQEEVFDISHVANALAEYQKHAFLAVNTPWDLYLRGDKKILSTKAKEGAIIFSDKAKCSNCHHGAHLTGFDFDHIAIPSFGPGAHDEGRSKISLDEEDKYKFRVSPLRNIALTSPYMHNGIYLKLIEVIDHYDRPIHFLKHFEREFKNPYYEEVLKIIRDPLVMREQIDQLPLDLPRHLNLTVEEKEKLLCFLMVGLTDIKLQTHLEDLPEYKQLADCPRVR